MWISASCKYLKSHSKKYESLICKSKRNKSSFFFHSILPFFQHHHHHLLTGCRILKNSVNWKHSRQNVPLITWSWWRHPSTGACDWTEDAWREIGATWDARWTCWPTWMGSVRAGGRVTCPWLTSVVFSPAPPIWHRFWRFHFAAWKVLLERVSVYFKNYLFIDLFNL